MKFNFQRNIVQHKTVSHGGIYSIKGKSPQDTIDFSSNISPLGFPPLVKKEIKKAIKQLSVYPDSDSQNLRKNLAWYTGTSSKKIVVGNGATEIIYNFASAILSEKTPVLIPIPTFGEYEAACKLAGCTNLSFFKTMNLTFNLDQFLDKIPKEGCIFVCNPNNPTGVLIPRAQMLQILVKSKKNSTIVFVDESFIELTQNPSESLVMDLKKYDNLFILRSLTKSFGLAGIRIGYGLGNQKIISILNKIKIPWNVSGIAQKAASAALCHRFYLEKSRKVIEKEKKFLRDSLSKFSSLSCYDSDTNFILIKSKMKSKILQKKLLAKKILVRDCSSFRGLNNNHVRIAVKTHKENLRLVKSLQKVVR